ncbi:MAG TPA: DUF881 domain-containing protein [Jatrophihabitantaceae bacterium]|jgi:uncharacterized protein YlxW (UPF0749 family)|nr:DUF881 domain-containing protein [Jatrophihabitantaceae bacterium]
MTGSSPQRPLTTQLLVDLVTDTLDPGYAAAAARRGAGGSGGSRRRFDRPAVAIGCALIGFVLVIAYIHTHRGAPQAAKVHDRLVARVRAAQSADARLAASAEALNATLSRLRASAGLGSLTNELDKEQLLAGQVAVSGPGLEVDLSEPPRATSSPTPGRGGATPIGATHILTDRDVRSVVNELWADGAEAISINDVRLTPTSAIRFAGEAVLVDFQPITSPYVIRAIGNADDLATGFASSAVASRYHTLASADGIGFGFSEHTSMHLPANAGVLPSLAHAASPTPTGTSR